MSVAQTAPPQAQVLFRHRRRMPALHFGVVGAIFLVVGSFAASSLLLQAALVLAAIGVLGLGWLGRRRLWVEDQLLTPTSAVVVHADGATFEVPFDEVARVAARSNAVAFVRTDGAELRFNRNPHAKRIRRVLSQVAPDLAWVDEIDPACDT